MKTDKNFKFTLNVSSEGYKDKKEATCCLSSKGAAAIGRKKMCFFEHSLTVDEFLAKAQSGFSFCALFRFEEGKKYWYTNSKKQHFLAYPHYTRDSKTATKDGLKIDFKRDDYFSGSQVIFIDIDYTSYTDINTYISKLTFKPTCVYMSYSDNKEKHSVVSRRFHLVYVFDKILTTEFGVVSHILSTALELDTKEPLEDKCGENMSQYMNGCFGNKENYSTYTIYSIEDIIEYRNNILFNNIEYSDDKDTTINLEMENKDATKINVQIQDTVEESIFDEELLKLFDTYHNGNDYERFLKTRKWEILRQNTKYYYRVEKENWINDIYQQVDENYFKLFWYVHAVKDGSKRRKGLYQRMCLRRVINPTISVEELVVNTIIDIIRFYDNEDGVLNSEFIRRNIESCLELTVDEIEESFSGELKYLRKTSKPKKGIIYKSKKAHSKITTFEILDSYYDVNLSVKENLVNLNDVYGFIVKKSTIYDYLKDRGIKTDNRTLTDEEVYSLLDISKSISFNVEYIKSLGYKISKDRISKLLKSVKDNSIVTTINPKMEKKDTVKINSEFFNDVDYFDNLINSDSEFEYISGNTSNNYIYQYI